MKLYWILIGLLLSSCANLQPIFKDAPVADITIEQANDNLESYKNTMVRWGGVIIGVKNTEEASLLQVIYYPLDYYGRPQSNEINTRHFVIHSKEHLNHKDYAVEREVTVLGVIEGNIEQIISNNKTNRVPLIKSTAIHLWPINYHNNYFSHCPSCYFRQLFW